MRLEVSKLPILNRSEITQTQQHLHDRWENHKHGVNYPLHSHLQGEKETKQKCSSCVQIQPVVPYQPEIAFAVVVDTV